MKAENRVIELYKKGLNANKISKLIGKSYNFVSVKIEEYKSKTE